MLVNVYLYGGFVVLCCRMEPAIESKIPIYIRNTFEPKLAGTRIYLPTKVSYRAAGAWGMRDGGALMR